jgi:GMP reductase
MILENGTKLDFDDVLIKPKRSTLESRKDVNLVRQFKTRHGKKLEGVPIIASNMATGNFKMLCALA